MKEYLGDGVYAEMDRYGSLVLTTEDGIRATNRIVLEPEVLIALSEYLERLKVGKFGLSYPKATALARKWLKATKKGKL